MTHNFHPLRWRKEGKKTGQKKGRRKGKDRRKEPKVWRIFGKNSEELGAEIRTCSALEIVLEDTLNKVMNKNIKTH